MSYLLAQILVCLLIAGLIGAIIGWLLRGGCSRKLRDCEDEWKMRVGSLENEYNSKIEGQKLYENNSEHATLKKSIEVKEDTGHHALSMNDVKSVLSKRNIYLDDKKISLYSGYDIDFKNGNNLEDNYDIEAIEGIDANQAKIFKGLGVHTTNDLITKLNKDHNEITKIAKELQVKPEAISSWISMSDLIKLPGVDGKTAKLMQTVGISSLSELSDTNPLSLYNEMVVFNNKSNLISKEPSLDSIKTWSKVAKYL